MFIGLQFRFRWRGDGPEGRSVGRVDTGFGRCGWGGCGANLIQIDVGAPTMASKKTKKSRPKKAKRSSSHYPVVKQAPISAGASANTLVDTARFLSVLNRRLYRMGRNYSMKVDVRPDFAGPIEVFVLRDDWAVQKAYQMAYQAYLDNSMDEREKMSSTQIARWEDFRVEDGLILAGGVNQARPVMHQPGGGASVLNAGEFIATQVVDESNVQRTFTWGTPGPTQYGILQEYDKAGNAQLAPESDVVGSVGPYAGINSDVDGEMFTNLEAIGNAPPYDQDGVNAASPWVRVAVLGSAGGVQRLSSGFFTAPCGLILLKGYTDVTENYNVTIEAKSGDYKGVHAPSMIEVATVNRKRKVVK